MTTNDKGIYYHTMIALWDEATEAGYTSDSLATYIKTVLGPDGHARWKNRANNEEDRKSIERYVIDGFVPFAVKDFITKINK